MNPAHKAEDILQIHIPNMPETTEEAEVANYVASAQVYATLALAQAIEGLGDDIREALRGTNAELGAISITLGEGR